MCSPPPPYKGISLLVPRPPAIASRSQHFESGGSQPSAFKNGRTLCLPTRGFAAHVSTKPAREIITGPWPKVVEQSGI